jgi:hypothetical protein
MITTQGQEANKSGVVGRSIVEMFFRERGVPIRAWSSVKRNVDFFEPHVLLRDPPYKSTYDMHSDDPMAESTIGHVFRRRAFDQKGDVRIITRWQQDGGSTDEKFPFLFENVRDRMPEMTIWIYVDGGAARPKALTWLQAACAGVKTKEIVVIEDIEELRKMIRSVTAPLREAAE